MNQTDKRLQEVAQFLDAKVAELYAMIDTEKSDPMSFQDAQEELEKIADGEYYTIAYQIDSHNPSAGRSYAPKCTVYIHEYEHITGSTWEEALRMMKTLKGENTVIEEQIPA